MTVYWPVFFGSAAAIFVALNAVFGFLYSLGHDPVANTAENGPLAYFYFSIETLATVGYGDMAPANQLRASDRDGRNLHRHEFWMLFHIIDKESPLHGVTAPDLEESDALLVLNVGGLDDGSAQQLYARHVYSWRDIRWHHRYKDVTSVSPQGRFLLDYTKFHDVVADE